MTKPKKAGGSKTKKEESEIKKPLHEIVGALL